ncbi:Endonuclease/exonuclease/phosphatase [Mycena galopus ATCC 62051]|nr:Endonuclease/exonuclease/phosphatase [Mycena galopus ATCC 62051]
MSESSAINVLTLNCWGLKYVAKNRTDRVHAIANELAKFDHDIIALQEIWVFADYEHVRDSVIKRLPGALGSGLALLSRFPIIGTSVHPYSLNGAPIDVAGGDWFVGKAAVSIIISHPVLGQVQVFNTHLYAKGGEDGPEYNRAHRIVNAWEFPNWRARLQSLAAMSLLPEISTASQARCQWRLFGNTLTSPTRGPLPIPSRRTYLPIRHGRYNPVRRHRDSPLNSYSAGKPIGPYARKFLGKRLDYILYRQPIRPPPRHEDEDPLPVLKCTECNVLLTEKVPGRPFSFSDHFALEATLEIQPGPEPLLTWRTRTTSGRPRRGACACTGHRVGAALAACYRFSRQRAKKELSLFAGCIFILLVLVVGSSWLTHAWINPIFILFTIFVAWLGTTMLYEGFLYGNWECNALMNVIEELEIYKTTLEIQAGNR